MRAHIRFSRASFVVSFALAIGASVLASAPAAHAQRYELGIGTANYALTASSADALTDSSMPAVLLSGGVHLPGLAVTGLGLRFRIDGTLEHGAVDGTTFRTMASTTRMTMAAVGVSALRGLGTRWQAFGRVAVGGARIGVELDDVLTSVEPLQDRGYAACAQLGAGAELGLGLGSSGGGGRGLELSLRLELGYTAVSGVDMRPVPQDRANEQILRIPAQSTSLGPLDLSAWTTRLALVGRF